VASPDDNPAASGVHPTQLLADGPTLAQQASSPEVTQAAPMQLHADRPTLMQQPASPSLGAAQAQGLLPRTPSVRCAWRFLQHAGGEAAKLPEKAVVISKRARAHLRHAPQAQAVGCAAC
jgi:hypothetical protein